MNVTMSMATMCQGSRLMGMQSSDEHCLESYFRKLVIHNGSDYAVAQLKTLKEITIRQIEDPHYKIPRDYFSNGNQPLSWNWTSNSPKGPLSVIHKTWKKPSSRIRGIGMLINSFTNDGITKTQFKKLSDGINTDGKYCDNNVLPLSKNDARRFIKSLNRHMKQMHVFNGTDLTGSLMPYGNYVESIESAKKGLLSDDSSTRHKAIASLSHALDGQVKYAPTEVRKFVKEHFPSYRDVDIDMSERDNLVRDYEYNPKYKLWGRYSNPPRAYAGTMSMLQKAGCKLRSVFNTNRFINHAMTPYGEAIEDAFYAPYPHHVFVRRQDKGLQSIQHMIKRKHHLVSADLTSATDRMNFRVFTNGLRHAIILDMYIGAGVPRAKALRMARKYCTLNEAKKFCEGLKKSSIISKPRMGTNHDYSAREAVNAIESVNLFESTASRPFYSKDLESAIGLRTGQPLGMMGSFQTLTAMNFAIGRVAEIKATGRFSKQIPQFAVVGDDFVGDESIMKTYSEEIRNVNGLDNHEKALRSNDHAEFLSHLISRNSIVSMKPKFRLGRNAMWVNAEKTSSNKVVHCYRLSEEDRNSIEILAAIGDPESIADSLTTSSRLPRDEREIVQSTLKRISLEDTGTPDDITVSQESVSLSRDETNIDRKYLGTNLNFSRKDKSGQYNVRRPIETHNDESYSPIIDRYDHKSAKRVDKSTLGLKAKAEASKRKAKLAQKIIDTYENGTEHYVQKPYHKDTKYPVSGLILDGMQAIENSDLVDNSPFPSANGGHDIHNEIDRSRSYEENATSEFSDATVIIPSYIKQYVRYLITGRAYTHILSKDKFSLSPIDDRPNEDKLKLPIINQDEYDQFGESLIHQHSSKMISDLDKALRKDPKLFSHEHSDLYRSIEREIALDPPKSSSSACWYSFTAISHYKSSDLTAWRQLTNGKDDGLDSSTRLNTDNPELHM